LTDNQELNGVCVTSDVFDLSRRRRLALCAVAAAALLLFLAPAVLAAWSVVDSKPLDRAVAGLEPISRLAVVLEVGRFPLFLVLVSWLARSPRER
jgi:hypothetical protein